MKRCNYGQQVTGYAQKKTTYISETRIISESQYKVLMKLKKHWPIPSATVYARENETNLIQFHTAPEFRTGESYY